MKQYSDGGVGSYGEPGGRRAKKPKRKKREGLSDSAGKALTSDSVSKTFEIRGRIAKVSPELGLVFGWAIVTHEDGEPYFDLQHDHITQKAMLESATDFAQNSRVVKEQHTGDQVGTVLHIMPLTDDVAEAFGIECDKRGLMIAVKPEPGVMAKFASGELTGFSIGGVRGEDEEVD